MTNRYDEIHSETIRGAVDELVNTIAACQGTLNNNEIIVGTNSVRFAIHKNQQRVLREREEERGEASHVASI